MDAATRAKISKLRALIRTREAEAFSYQVAEDFFTMAMDGCGSPIEHLFALALLAELVEEQGCKFGADVFTWSRDATDLSKYPQRVKRDFLHVRSAVFVLPQFQLPGARVDFLVFRYDEEGDELVRSPFVIVECDGHEYHERTPDQAERDRSRDRAFQQAGFTVFRFTGRELWRDASACASQVMDFLWEGPR